MAISTGKERRETWKDGVRLAVFGPLVLAANLLLLLGGEVVLDVERLSDLVGRLALDHVGDGLAADVEQRLDVEVVGSLRYVSMGTKCCCGYVGNVRG